MRSVLLFTVPTVGHFNSSIALAQILESRDWRCDIVTGARISEYAATLNGQISGKIHCLPSFDLNLDRSDPNRRSHFEQVFGHEHVLASVADIRALIADRQPDLFITKDYITPRLCAAEAGIPSAVYLTDGVEPLVLKHRLRSKEITADFELAFEAALDQVGLAEVYRDKDGRVAELRLARGYRRTSLIPPDSEPLIDDIVFLGSLVFDAPREIVAQWQDKLARLPRPLIYITFGTVNGDSGIVERVALAASRCAATVVVTHLSGWTAVQGMPANVHGEAYIPNAAALSVADVICHHGGHGTMLSALTHAVPSVVLPLNAETSAQALHAEMLGVLGVGRMLGVDADQASIEKAFQLARDPEVRKRSAHLRDELIDLDDALRAGALAEIERFAKIERRRTAA